MTIVVSLSGGLDSSMLLCEAVTVAPSQEVRAVSFDYGQRHAKELEQAAQIAAHLDVSHRVIDLSGLLTGSSLLNDGEVPDGHYAEQTMKATVVLGRNLLFATAALSTCQPGDEVWLAVHGGDHFIYPDCRPTFITPLAEAVAAAYEVTIRAPFIEHDKTYIASLAARYPTVAAMSWSCYKGGDQHCGRCGTCVERAEAFHLAGIPDPTTYIDPTFWQTTVAAWNP
jgi:7-cyano-7-deazaguanine synthase